VAIGISESSPGSALGELFLSQDPRFSTVSSFSLGRKA